MTRRTNTLDEGAEKARADAVFRRKQDQKREGELATKDYQAEQNATLDKTARLRALRLARDADPDGNDKPATRTKAKTKFVELTNGNEPGVRLRAKGKAKRSSETKSK